MEQRGALPTTGQIDFEFSEFYMSMLDKGLINDFKMEAIISSPDKPSETKKKIKLSIDHVQKPGSFYSETESLANESSDFTEEVMGGLSRSRNYLMDKIITPKSWILFGKLQGDNPVPIIIFFHVELKVGTYSFKKKGEKLKMFNPQLN